MKNWEYYECNIKAYGIDNFTIKKDNKCADCRKTNCNECRFNDKDANCGQRRAEWLYEEFKEPIRLTCLEYELLKYFSYEHKYISRDIDDKLYIYVKKPTKTSMVWRTDNKFVRFDTFKNLFQFIKWSDEEPTLIRDVLGNCIVIENE